MELSREVVPGKVVLELWFPSLLGPCHQKNAHHIVSGWALNHLILPTHLVLDRQVARLSNLDKCYQQPCRGSSPEFARGPYIPSNSQQGWIAALELLLARFAFPIPHHMLPYFASLTKPWTLLTTDPNDKAENEGKPRTMSSFIPYHQASGTRLSDYQ